MKSFFPVILFIAVSALLFSCNSMGDKSSHGPITLGDSSTIVTEADSQYRRDFVTDLKPAEPQPEEAKKDTLPAQGPAQPSAAQPAAAAPAAQPAPAAAGNGLTIAFKEVTLFLPGISAKGARNQNLQKANGATFQLQSGTLDGSQIKATSGTITKISMRYTSSVVARNNLGTLQLGALDASSPWQPMKGGNNVYNITGLDAKHIIPARAGAGDIRNAVVKATKQARMSRKAQQQWQNSLRNVRSVNQRPLSVYLHSVMWKIEGKDAAGKPFQKQIRIDLNA